MSLGHRHPHLLAHARDRLDERRRLLLSLALTGAVLAVEVAGGIVSGSLSLLADAGHMLSDVAAQVISLLALAIAARPADVRRTYGYHRVEILAALANGLALIALSGWIFWNAWVRLHGERPEIRTGLMLVVAVVGLVANLGGAWLLHGARSLNVRGAYLHVLTDSLSSLAVVIGAGAMHLARGWYVIDPALSIALGLFVLWGAYRLVREAVDVLLETVPAEIDAGGVGQALAACAGVRDVHDLHIWTITSGMYALSAHVVVDQRDLHRNDSVLTEMKELLMSRFRIAHSTIQIESSDYEHVDHTCAAPPQEG